MKTPEEKARAQKVWARYKEECRLDRLYREIKKAGWEFEIWESHRPGSCFAPQWRFEAWKMADLGGRFGWVSTRYRWGQGLPGYKKEEPPFVVLAWSCLEVVERFYRLFCLPKEES